MGQHRLHGAPGPGGAVAPTAGRRPNLHNRPAGHSKPRRHSHVCPGAISGSAGNWRACSARCCTCGQHPRWRSGGAVRHVCRENCERQPGQFPVRAPLHRCAARRVRPEPRERACNACARRSEPGFSDRRARCQLCGGVCQRLRPHPAQPERRRYRCAGGAGNRLWPSRPASDRTAGGANQRRGRQFTHMHCTAADASCHRSATLHVLSQRLCRVLPPRCTEAGCPRVEHPRGPDAERQRPRPGGSEI